MRRFGTQGRVYPEENYVVSRTGELVDFINYRILRVFKPTINGVEQEYFPEDVDDERRACNARNSLRGP